jgi:hypothetical protein
MTASKEVISTQKPDFMQRKSQRLSSPLYFWYALGLPWACYSFRPVTLFLSILIDSTVWRRSSDPVQPITLQGSNTQAREPSVQIHDLGNRNSKRTRQSVQDRLSAYTCNWKSSEATIGMLHGLAVTLMALPARYSISNFGSNFTDREKLTATLPA